MGKLVVIVGLLSACLVAGMIYFFQKPTPLSETLKSAATSDPRIVVDEFSVFRYEGHNLTATFSGQMGHFIEPDVIEVFAAVKAARFKGDQEESLQAEAAHAQFNADHMRDLLNHRKSTLIYAEVEDKVRLGMKDNVLKTERAQYFAETERIVSREPVVVQGPNREFSGEQGFVYSLPTEVLELPGRVHGVVKPDAGL